MATRAKTRGNVKPPPKPRAKVDAKPIISALYEQAQKPTGG